MEIRDLGFPRYKEKDYMEEEKKTQYISLKQASLISGYHPDYIGYLIRKGKLKGVRVG